MYMRRARILHNLSKLLKLREICDACITLSSLVIYKIGKAKHPQYVEMECDWLFSPSLDVRKEA